MYGVLTLLADKFHAMPDGMAKSDAAAKIFGARMGSEMIPILNELGGKLDSVKAEAQSLGIVWDEEGIKKMEALHHSATQLEGAMQGLALELTNDLGSSLIDIGKELATDIKLFAEFLGLGKTAEDKKIGKRNMAQAALQQPNMANDPNAEYWKQLQLYKAQNTAKLSQDQAQTAHGYPASWNRQKIDAHNSEVESLKADANRLDSEIDRVAGQILADQKKLEPKARPLGGGGGNEGGGNRGSADSEVDPTQLEESLRLNENRRLAFLDEARAQERQQINDNIEQIKEAEQKAADSLREFVNSIDFSAGKGLFPAGKLPIATLAPQMADHSQIDNEAEKYAHSIFDPLFNFGEKWDKQWKQIRANMLRDVGQTMESQLFKGLFGDPSGRGGRGWDGSGGDGKSGHNGLVNQGIGHLSGLLGGLFGKKTSPVSNGTGASGAGTVLSAAASAMQIGKKGSTGGGGIQVILNNNGNPLQVDQTQQSGGDGGEGQVIQIMLKQLETNGPVSRGIQGLFNQ
jgi:hypothetical protein